MPPEQKTSIYTAPDSDTGNLLRAAAQVMGVDTTEHGWAQKVIRAALTFYLVHSAQKGSTQ